ncbi:MAG TPA: DUF1800 domain-containing protein [Candidatus Saccharimonadales bacterium]|jgi:uncharacterized protein (DUF1800 family)|nr:DUF1800 domain-containing protein [Candidatus Saccharimonadales bacterium]
MRAHIIPALLLGLLTLALVPSAVGQTHHRKESKAPPKPVALTAQERALHVLQRLTFGPRPGDLEAVMATGVESWIEQQLNPAQIPDATLEGRLGPLRTLRLSPREAAQSFPSAQMIREAAEGKRAYPLDPVQFGLWEVLVDKYNEQQRNNASPPPALDDAARKALDQASRDAGRRLTEMLLGLPKPNRMTALMKLPLSDRRVLAQFLLGDLRDKLLPDFTPAERETYLALNNPTGVVIGELQQAKVLRVVYGERQLEEVMTDFWFNHFNIFLNKDSDQYFVTSYEREAIRPHALGNFRDMLVAVAKSPAMLFYLDNAASMGPSSQAAGVKPGQPPPAGAASRGLNENYGRELMELHTLGVDGGYTQNDVTQVARVFTGWTIQPFDQGWGFVFDPRRHDPGPKTVLGKTIQESGMNEGLQVLDMLAHSPATASFISGKLARRFVADEPPQALVAAMAETFLSTNGDIKAVLRTLFNSKEFWSPVYYRKKVKTPLEFVASAVRATGAQVQNPGALVQALNKMGMPLYQMQPPTGYSTRAEVWMNSDALLERLNFAIGLTTGGLGGVNCDPLRVLALGLMARSPREDVVRVNTSGGTDAAVTLVEDALIGGALSQQSDSAIRKSLADPKIASHTLDDPGKLLGTVVGLALGSPEFQER